MMEGETSGMMRNETSTDRFTDTVFSWSLEDIANEDLYKDKVEKIADSFQSVRHYLGSYVYPLLEDTRAQLYSSMEILCRAPFAKVVAFDESKPCGTKVYQVTVDYWKNRSNDRSKDPYRTLPGDLLVLANAKPETLFDLERIGRSWAFLSVTNISEDENGDDVCSTYFKVKASKEFELEIEMQTSLYVVYVANMTTQRRIWKALHMFRNPKILNDVLCVDSEDKKDCDSCFKHGDDIKLVESLSSNLNESQSGAILSCLHMLHCNENSAFQLIWGPPGTGKTKTIASLLVALLRKKYRTVICAPTNVAITEVASRVLKMVLDKEAETLFCSSGDILLFGNKERLKVGLDEQEIFLDYRVQRLAECSGALGLNQSFNSAIHFLEDCVPEYHVFLENQSIIEREQSTESETKEKGCTEKSKSFLEFARERLVSIFTQLRKCISILHTHIPKSYLPKQTFQNLVYLDKLLDCFKSLLFQDNVVSEELEELFSRAEVNEDPSSMFVDETSLLSMRSACLSVLRTLLCSLKGLDLPSFRNEDNLRKFCFQRASLIFCTASSSYKLHGMEIDPLNVLVIDEAAQLKECESIIALQLQGINHVVLVGDECQLPATVTSKVSEEARFGRSLFERLNSQKQSKRLLNVQYRMHPAISSFPNLRFYHNQIHDAPVVKRKSYEMRYLPGSMFGPYSFLNVIGGREEKDDDGHSRKNMVEVAIVLKILQNLYKAWLKSYHELSVGVVSPYSAQVVAIQEKLGKKYEKIDGFQVKVRTVDGFQGGEEDIIIMTTVRSSIGQSLEFISRPERVNVALTRARHALWILGNERALSSSQSLWGALIVDAKNRGCFFNADDETDLAKAIVKVKKELDQFDDLLNAGSALFRNSLWMVRFSDNFLKSFKKLTSKRRKQSVLSLLLNLSNGWRPKRLIVDSVCGSSLEIMKFKVEGLFVISSVDVVKDSKYMQVLKIWDVLPPDDVPKLIKRLDDIFGNYTDDFIKRCNEKSFEGNVLIPKNWPPSLDVVRFKDLTNNETGNDLVGAASDGRSYVENSKVNESLLLMKFYSLSPRFVNHLLSDRDDSEIDLPFEVTDEEMEIILFRKSTFVLGRSGTGKTTVLTKKLFQKEQLHHSALEEYYGVKADKAGHDNQSSSEETSNIVLRQLFVTVSPKLCNAVKQHVSHLKSFACGGNRPHESNLTSMADIEDEDAGIPDSFFDITPDSYPLVITFHKFLMMLDGTLSKSYFERFLDLEKLSHSQRRSSRSVLLQTFLRTKEVDYEKFTISYWPHFDSKLTTKLDPSRVFTEIISHIKGGLQALEKSNLRLSSEDYIILAEGRSSTLTRDQRERIYDIFEVYERMKMGNGEFDLADFVNDLHRRLKHERYEADQMHFVYIDEVQDLAMSQIALFRHICSNVEEGFVFSGDTAQTIARGIDFRFQDIRHLFYKKFVLESQGEHGERKDKGRISDIFHLTQNFRTHAGILKLSQSIIELLYHFFPQSIDPLKPETSLIFGEAPIVLQSGDDENAIIKIFGNSGNKSQDIVGFGAEQVILVRDDNARKEISNHVGKQALLLTILECKGLEFQDVLLYNFFGSSPLKNQWRLIYEYMKEQDLFESMAPKSPKFSMSKHNILCSELKQLYVAVTRTRQRLWICDNTELAEPMFEYWKKKHLVQVRQLDDSLAQAMQVASSPEEWRSRGIKLYYEHNYEMATMCFERASDAYWEKMSKAAGLKAMADRMRVSNPEEANSILREAAEIFEAIGKADYAARCFSDLGEYERAGHIYLEKFGEAELVRAGECFSLAGGYELAAKVYARGNYFSECLTACAEGKLFDKGLDYIQEWKQQTTKERGVSTSDNEMDKIEQKFLENCAFHYHEVKDNRSMMKFVRAFSSMNSIRNFLRPLGCFNELMLLEEESGNFLEAADIAKLRGDLLLMVDLLGKAGKFREGANLILFYVLANSLWSQGSRGWPLKQFEQKCELLTKAKSFATKENDNLYEFVCTEADVMENEQSDLVTIMNQMITSRRHKSVRGEILSARKILDIHLSLKVDKYFFERELVFDLSKHSEDVISKNQVSIESLVYFWDFWKDKIVSILEYLGCLETQDASEFRYHGEFCLNFLGVWRQFNNLNPIFFLLSSVADWARDIEKRPSSGKLVSIDVHQFIYAAKRYWCSEMLSVGFMVLEKLKALYNFPQIYDLLFSRSRILTLIHEVANFFLESTILELRHHDSENLLKFIKLATDSFVGFIYPMCWHKSMTENMIFLRETDACNNLLKELVAESVRPKQKLSYGQIGSIAMIILGSRNLKKELNEQILRGMDWNSPWKAFFENLCRVKGSNHQEDTIHVSQPRVASEMTSEAQLVRSFREALADVYNANWRKVYDYISPTCFLYLLERLLIWSCSFSGSFVSTKSMFVEWLMFGHEEHNGSTKSISPSVADLLTSVIEFMRRVVQECLHNPRDMIDWIRKSTTRVTECYSIIVLRMVVLTFLLHTNFNMYMDPLIGSLRRDYIIQQLPLELGVALKRMRKNQSPALNVNLMAEALKKIGDPLVTVSLGRTSSFSSCTDVILVNMKGNHCKNDILRTLFPEKAKAPKVSSEVSAVETEDKGEPSKVSQDIIASGTRNSSQNNESKGEGNSNSKDNKNGTQVGAASEAQSSNSQNTQSKGKGNNKSKDNKNGTQVGAASEARSSNSQNTQSKGKGNNKSKKNKKGKGGRKK